MCLVGLVGLAGLVCLVGLVSPVGLVGLVLVGLAGSVDRFLNEKWVLGIIVSDLLVLICGLLELRGHFF